jgi:tetratricopeptide (TPR) repeat protein
MRGVLEALHQGDYDTAIERLTRKALFGRKEEAKEALLLLAEVHSLYGEEGLEKAHRALEEAYELGELEYSPLYRALLGELLALEGRPEREVLPLFLPTEDPRARYHQAQALFYLGRFEEVLNTLRPGLPAFLAWRAEGLKGRALERLGRHREAALAYERGAGLALGLERYWLLLDAAAMWLEAGEGERALMALEEAKAVVGEGEGAEDAATRHYLLARAHLLLGNPNRALEEARRALEKEEESGHQAYGTPMVAAQALSQLGRYQEAMEAYEEALLAGGGGGAALRPPRDGGGGPGPGGLSGGGRVPEGASAGGGLPLPGPGPGRTWRRPSTARGGTRKQRRWPGRPCALGAEASGELILGHIAYDLMHLEEALAHYRQAAEQAEEGSREWVGAQEMVVDTLAQLGYRSPEEILARTEAVLPYVHPADEWHQALLAYKERAEALLREGRRPN